MASPPTHRIVTRRVLLVSLVVGVVLAALSVPMSSLMLVYAPLGAPSAVDGVEVVDRHLLFIQIERYPTATLWMVQSAPPSPYGDAVEVVHEFGAGVRTDIGTLPEMSGMAALPGGRMWVMRAGWPMRAATTLQIVSPQEAATGVVGGFTANVRGDSIVVPYIPLALGAMANTLFYAAIVFAVIASLGLVRKRRRRARGQCLACGYALDDGMSECPECGLSTQAS